MEDLKNKIKEKFPGIIFNEPLKNHTTMRVGGDADFFYKLIEANDLPVLLKFAAENGLSYFFLAGGSNVLFDDNGFRGLVIKNETNEISIDEDVITVDSGVRIADLIKFSLKNNLSGLEKWASLPGTVGGAVRGNAGCNDLETKDILKSATIFDPETNKIKEVQPNYFEFSYRNSKVKSSSIIILSATFQLQKSTDLHAQQNLIKEIKEKRATTQPPGFSSGSFFKNPSPTQPAGQLIDQAGLKGYALGGAKISEKHANFIINTGTATAKDIRDLAHHAKQQVKAKFGLALEEEVQILNEHGKIKLP